MRLTVEPSTDPQDYEFSHNIRVRFVETDAMAIVHHSNYLAYFEETRVAFLAGIGHPFTEWRAAGLESPVLESFVQSRQPVFGVTHPPLRRRAGRATDPAADLTCRKTIGRQQHDPRPQATAILNN